MNAKHLALSACLLAPALVAFALPAEKIRFAPAEGSSVSKTFETKTELTLDNMSISMNGNQMPGMPEMDMTITSTQSVEVSDEYVAMGDGQPKKLKRHFDSMDNSSAVAMKMEMMGQSQDQNHNAKAVSKLNGKTVVFSWDAEAKEYKKAFDPAEDGAETLAGLKEDMDLRVLLPDHEVKVGEEWAVDVKSLVHVLAPGGDLQFRPEDAETAEMAMNMMGGAGMSSMSDLLSDLLEGEAKASLADVREEDGKKLAAIKFNVKISSSKDMTELVHEAMKNAKLPEGVEMEVDHVDVDFKLEGEGELVWNLTTNTVHRFELSGPVHMDMDMAMAVDGQGQQMKFEQSMEMSGTTTITVKAN
jgi:hypothetical protein